MRGAAVHATAAETPPPDDPRKRFYRRMLQELDAAGAPYLVGGAYALGPYTGVTRDTKDFDIFVRPEDLERVEAVLAAAGCEVERFAPFWLSKATLGEDFIDVIHSSGNGVATVDDLWFEHAGEAVVFGVPVRIVPAEEMLWSKAFIMERERFDGADVLHILHECASRLDWPRLVARFGEAHWRVLLAHLTLFGFVYPQRRAAIPDWVMAELTRRLRREQRQTPPRLAVCRGTLLSRSQYAIDVESWGYRDGRLAPEGKMTREDIALWERRRQEDQEGEEIAEEDSED
jgi:hypothetical protein